MRIANLKDRAIVVVDENRYYDVAEQSDGRFGPGMLDVFAKWDDFVAWAGKHVPSATTPLAVAELGSVSPRAGQVFAIGLNYLDHSRETGIAVSREFPPVFPKWQSSLARPNGTVAVPAESHIDWEVELVAVIGKRARRVAIQDAMACVAGFAVGQDFSDRKVQFIGQAPQFGLAKSFEGFSPVGPWLVTPDEVGDLSALEIRCEVDGVVKQQGTLGQMIFSVPEIISILSQVVTLEPGDLIFTGTPAGVGYARKPAEFLQPGSRVVSTITGIGQIEQAVVLRQD